MPDGLPTDSQLPPMRESALASTVETYRATTIRIAGIYFGLGLLWMWLTDLSVVLSGEQSVRGFLVSAGKGTLFICATTVLVYWLVRRGFHAI